MPAQIGSKNQVELIYRQLSQPSNGPDVWIGRDVLKKERSRPEGRDLKPEPRTESREGWLCVGRSSPMLDPHLHNSPWQKSVSTFADDKLKHVPLPNLTANGRHSLPLQIPGWKVDEQFRSHSRPFSSHRELSSWTLNQPSTPAHCPPAEREQLRLAGR
jgi:hypothetical protein